MMIVVIMAMRMMYFEIYYLKTIWDDNQNDNEAKSQLIKKYCMHIRDDKEGWLQRGRGNQE